MCTRAKQKNLFGSIDYVLCKNILSEAYSAGSRRCALSDAGEPLLNYQLEDLIAFAKDVGYEYVFINTNGYLATPDRGRSLIDSGLDSIKFSINSSRENYKLIHGVDAYDRVMTNLRSLFKYRNSSGSSCGIYVSCVATPYTLKDIDVIKEETASISDDFMAQTAKNQAGGGGVVEICTSRDDLSFTFPCSQLFNTAYVTPEGYLKVCCSDFTNQGIIADLNKISITYAWNCDKFAAFRREYLNGNIKKGSICYNCLNDTYERVDTLTPEIPPIQEDEELTKEINERILLLKGGFCLRE
jgi:hypothetical protein